MSEFSTPTRIPPGALFVARESNTSGVAIYTVPAGRRLHITALWLIANTVASVLSPITLTGSGIVGDATARIFLRTIVPAGPGIVSLVLPLSPPISLDPGGTVIPSSGQTDGTIIGGLLGWEEAKLSASTS